ncbi:MAG: hypothetical protein KGL39_04560 [Patescibacteria group bacterium]|nr:hypothetical protein [Patescibacteria group bacterium]
MPFAKLELAPGINTQVSRYASEPTWVASQLIRWLNGQLRKFGGWQKLINVQMQGVARGMHAWADLVGNAYLIVGTSERVYLYDGGVLEDITPLRVTDDVSPDFSTTASSPIVTVVDTSNGSDSTDWVYMPVQVSVGGLILYGYYQLTVVDANTYTITASSNATSTVSNGGAVPEFTTIMGQSQVTVTLNDHGQTTSSIFPINISTAVGGLTIFGGYAVVSVTDANNFVIDAGSAAASSASAFENSGNVEFQYLIHSGTASPTSLSGWGGGNWGEGDWGLANSSGAVSPLRQWFFDYWGEDAIGNYTNGPMYIWIPPYASNPRMTVISQAPAQQTAMFTAMPEQIVVSLGAETGGTQDPNLIRWSDVGDYTDWTPTAANQAGSFRIPTGSRIVGGIQTPLQALIWTDIDVYAMQYEQPPFVFGFNRVGQGCGMIAARAATVIGGVIYWMSQSQFFRYDGSVLPVKCDVWDVIFRDISTYNADKIFAAKNSLFNEITWFYPSASGNGEVDSYVKLNIAEGLWDYGSLIRTAWEDQSVLGPPIGADGNGYLQQHETGNDADGVPMVTFATSSFVDLANGEEYIFVDQMLPSFQDISDSTALNLTLTYAKNTSDQVLNTKGPYSLNASTQYIPTRIRGRFVSITMGSSDLGSFWQLGALRYRYSDDGRFG